MITTRKDKYTKHIIVDGKKICGKCEEWLPIDRFNRDRRNSTGLFYVCRICTGKYDSHAAWIRTIKRKYGLTEDQYMELFNSQNGRCAICKDEPNDNNTKKEGYFSIDHSHDTGVIRGLLCLQCNMALGYMKDNKDNLMAAYDYLNK